MGLDSLRYKKAYTNTEKKASIPRTY